MLPKNTKIFLAGHNGMVGSSIYKELINQGYKNIITASKKKLNLLDQKKDHSVGFYSSRNYYCCRPKSGKAWLPCDCMGKRYFFVTIIF